MKINEIKPNEFQEKLILILSQLEAKHVLFEKLLVRVRPWGTGFKIWTFND